MQEQLNAQVVPMEIVRHVVQKPRSNRIGLLKVRAVFGVLKFANSPTRLFAPQIPLKTEDAPSSHGHGHFLVRLQIW